MRPRSSLPNSCAKLLSSMVAAHGAEAAGSVKLYFLMGAWRGRSAGVAKLWSVATVRGMWSPAATRRWVRKIQDGTALGMLTRSNLPIRPPRACLAALGRTNRRRGINRCCRRHLGKLLKPGTTRPMGRDNRRRSAAVSQLEDQVVEQIPWGVAPILFVSPLAVG